MNQKNYNKLKEVICEDRFCIRCGVSEKETRRCGGGGCNGWGKFYGNHKYGFDDIGLEDVLMAMKKPYTGYKCLEKNSNKIRIVCDDIRIEWNLKEPLDNQTDELKEFIYKLIVEK